MGKFHYIKGVRQAGKILIDQRNDTDFQISGFDAMLRDLDTTSKANFSKAMLEAAEPHLVGALDSELTRHPGTLQESMKSTGAKENNYGGWYLAYRATTGNEKPKEKRKNPEKMIYLINREYVREHVSKDGRTIRAYAIPADDVVSKSVERSENTVLNAMQGAFDKELGRIWDE